MALQSIARHTGSNMSGACYLDYVDVTAIDTFPSELAGNLEDTITLLDGFAFTRIYANILELDFKEGWTFQNGVLVPRAVVSYNVAKDDLNKLAGFWELQYGRYVVLFRNRNSQTLCVGSKTQGARFGIVERKSGRETDVNGYELQWTVARRTPVPFYLGTPPDVVVGPGSGGSLLTIDGTVGTLGTPDEALITVL